MNPNTCVFSPNREFRYTLHHRWDELFADARYVMFCGLNPSTADESELDPTLRRVRGFTSREGFSSFVMTNLFAYRATDPAAMLAHHAPVGPENDHWIQETARQATLIVAAWGADGGHLGRDSAVISILAGVGKPIYCLGHTTNKKPLHPLYLPASAALIPL